MSGWKAVKPDVLIGQTKQELLRRRIVAWAVAAVVAGGGYYGYRRYLDAPVEVPVVKVRQGEFVVSIKSRGTLESTKSAVLTVPAVPDMQITRLIEPGTRVKQGDVIVEFDKAQQEQNLLDRSTNIRAVDSEITQSQASQQITKEMDGMNKMTSQFNVERAALEVSKAEIVSQIEGEKSKIDLGLSKGELVQVDTTIRAHGAANKADQLRLDQKRNKAVRDLDRTRTYLSAMVLRAPSDGIAIILPNIRADGFGGSQPAFKVGDKVWTGASVAEIPDLREMRVNLELDEEERGRLKVGQEVRLKVDAIPEREFTAKLDWISPISSLRFRGWPPQKFFPAYATLQSLDARLRPGMSTSAEIIIENAPQVLLIPQRASFLLEGRPSVYVQKGSGFVSRAIKPGRRNETDLMVLDGVKEGEVIALEDPLQAAKKAKKL